MMIEMKDIRKIYQMGSTTVHALDGIDLCIAEREYVSIIGASGSGKSTLMHILGCLDVADEGRYALDGQEIEDYTEDELSTIRNRKIGFVFQQFHLLPKLTALENVELPLIYQRMPRAERRERSEAVLERVGLSDRMDHRPKELSGGQQQRVAVARALVTDPSILLADEPTGNLDSKTSGEIMEMLGALHEEGRTIILITHDAEIAERAMRVVRIRDGRITDDTLRKGGDHANAAHGG